MFSFQVKNKCSWFTTVNTEGRLFLPALSLQNQHVYIDSSTNGLILGGCFEGLKSTIHSMGEKRR